MLCGVRKILLRRIVSAELSTICPTSVCSPLSVDKCLRSAREGVRALTVKEDILEELRRGTPFAEIRRKFRSQSQLYEALGEYLAEADKIARARA